MRRSRSKEQNGSFPSVEQDAKALTATAFRNKYQESADELLHMRRNPTPPWRMTLRTIEVDDFKNEYLGYGPPFEVILANVRKVEFKETRDVDDFGP